MGTDMASGHQRIPTEDEIRDLSISRATELAAMTDWARLLDGAHRHSARMALRNLLAFDTQSVVERTARAALNSRRVGYVAELCAAIAEEGPETSSTIRQALAEAVARDQRAVREWIEEVSGSQSPAATAGARIAMSWFEGFGGRC